MKWIGQHIFDLKSKFRNDVTIDGDLTVSGTYTQIDTDVTTTEQWLVTNDGTGPAAIINQKGSQDIFDVQDDGTSVFYIEDGGNIGIGTTSPGEILHLESTAPKIKLSNSQSPTGYFTTIEQNYSYAGPSFAINSVSGATTRILLGRYSNNVSILPTGSGNVGIGTTSPSQKLDVVGDVKVHNTGSGNNATLFIDTVSGGNADSILNFREATVDRASLYWDGGDNDLYLTTTTGDFLINPSGNVGIGTTSPTYKLDVQDTGATYVARFRGSSSTYVQSGESTLSGESGFLAKNSTGALYLGVTGGVAYFTGTSGANTMKFGVGGAEKMRIDSSGNVGIGTTSPSQGLHVVDGGILVSQFESSDNTTSQIQVTNSSGNDAYFGISGSRLVLNNNDYGADHFSIDPSGNVGIGTTAPEEKLSVSGSIQLTNQQDLTWADIGDGNTGRVVIRGNEDADWIMFKTDNSERMRLTNTGLGIGTTSPASLLHVAGTVQVGVDDTGHDVKFYGATASHYMLWDQSADLLRVAGDLEIKNANGSNPSDAGSLVFNESGTTWGSDMYGFRLNLEGSSNLLQFQSANTSTVSTILTMGRDNLTSTFSGPVTVGVDDTGHDVIFYGATSGRKLTWDESADSLYFADDTYLKLGNGGDVKMWHNGDDSYIMNLVGDLNILNSANDKDIILKSDDGSGGHTAYLTLDGGLGFTTIQKHVRWEDGIIARFGNSDDGSLYHSGGHFYMGNNTGNIIITNTADDGDIIFQSDDGSGGVETYFQLEGGSGGGDPFTVFPDNSTLSFGSGHDYRFRHNGSDSYIQNYVGNLNLYNYTDDGNISFHCDDGSGGVTPYLTLDGGEGHLTVQKEMNFADGVRATFGNLAGGDMAIYHDGTNNYHNHYIGDVYFRNNADDKDIIFQCDDGSGGTTAYLTLDGSAGYITVQKAMRFGDGKTLQLGDSADLSLSHDATDSYITEKTGDLYIQNTANDKDIIFQSDDGSGGVATYFSLDGSLASSGYTYTKFPDKSTLSFGDANDLQIIHSGGNSLVRNFVGDLYITQYTDDGDIVLSSDDGSGGTTAYLTLDGSAGYTTAQKSIAFADGVSAFFGTGLDGLVSHSGTNMLISNEIGDLVISNRANDKDIILQSDDGSGGYTAYLTLDGSHGYTKAPKSILFEDSVLLQLGSSGDFQARHNTTDTELYNYTGDLKIANYANDKDIIFQSDDNSGGVKTYFYLDGSIGATIFPDSTSLGFGTGGDMYINHDGTNTKIDNYTGDFYIRQKSADKDLLLMCDDGSGGETAYLTLDGSAGTLEAAVPFNNTHTITSGGTITADTYFQSSDTSAVLASQNNGSVFLRPNGVGSGTGAFSVSAAGKATVSGELEATSLDINGVADISGAVTLGTPLATDQQKHLAWFEIAGFGTGDGTNYEISVNLDNDTAPFSHNVSTGADGTTAITVQNIMRSGGTVIPQAGTIKRWKGWATTAGSSTANVALFKITPTRNDNADVAPVLIDNVSYTAVGNAKMMDFEETSFTDASVAAGDIVVTGIKCEENKTTYFGSTLEIEF